MSSVVGGMAGWKDALVLRLLPVQSHSYIKMWLATWMDNSPSLLIDFF